MKIEFFHDVICSFCFPMSYRMREIEKLYPEIEIIHRSFPLVWEVKTFDLMFGNRKNAKQEILKHWQHADENDDLHRFNIEGMQKQIFDFPSSKNALLAAKAAFLIAGENGYWEIFDRLQQALFVENKNIENVEIIYQCIKETSLDFKQWQAQFNNIETLKEIEKDFELINKYQITSVPTLVINEEHLIKGAQPLSSIIETINEILNKDSNIKDVQNKACNLIDGKWDCK